MKHLTNKGALTIILSSCNYIFAQRRERVIRTHRGEPVPQRPFTHRVRASDFVPESYDNRTERRLSALEGQFADEAAFRTMIAHGDPLLYEVYEFGAERVPGGLLSGVSILHSGRVGEEYFMTKGHFHQLLETAESYYCLAGRGFMVMETPEGDTAVAELGPGTALYVPPRWAHRSVNIDDSDDLITHFVYPATAGHDYGTIESRGFRKLVVSREGRTMVVDNPKWLGSR